MKVQGKRFKAKGHRLMEFRLCMRGEAEVSE